MRSLRTYLGSAALAAAFIAPVVAALAQGTPQPAPGTFVAAERPEKSTAIPAPARQKGEGMGPFRRLVIRGVTLIDGSGSPPRGPVDIIIEGNRIAEIKQAGTPGLALKSGRPPYDADYEVDASGMYVLPGFIDMHVHGSTADKAPDLSYTYKLWLAHGVTTVRGVPLAPFETSLSEKARSARNEIVAPRIYAYQRPGEGKGWTGGVVNTPAKARAWVDWAAKQGIDGVKILNTPDQDPDTFAALCDEARKMHIGTVSHLSATGEGRMDAVEAGDVGLNTVTHHYGHFESLLKNGQIQDFRPDYNYNNEQDRFGDVADLAAQSYDPGSPEWMAYLAHQKANHVVFDPTMTIYLASRDLMRMRNADWHDKYTMPQLWDFYQSSRENHGSYFYDWTTATEIKWKNFYWKFMRLMNDYKNMGGRVTTGSDSGFIFETYGFGYIQELELFQEAGFNPLQVVTAATLNGALTLADPKGEVPEMGTVRVGKLADLVIVKENPLQNFKTLYGTGALRLNEQTHKLERVGGVSYTVKDGIVYDAKKLLAEVADMVAAEKRKRGLPDALVRP
ncbi:amidohydrolase family protein [Sphingomonas nostoxanthinifaciens]|uniref:amidohydrolase family protein n=1 Tax=Sphingomonas nostoxanthinifaciens TaxID=2872652 RepID=UPI001CC1E92B|nr:amidohydrolase family protein [Sphingomonas nostoxanthinifaciens]UAK22922.1 amidohydrolase family protein [Sphingomonas nostoxanthinifaciens]